MDSNKVEIPLATIEGTLSIDKVKAEHEESATLGSWAETSLTLSQAFRVYRKAIMWSVVMSMATVMESYDLILVTSFYAFPQFQERYGVQLDTGRYSIPAAWQVGFTMANVCGLVPGILANGWLVDRFGYRKVMLWSHISLSAFIFIRFFAPSREVMLVGCLLQCVVTLTTLGVLSNRFT